MEQFHLVYYISMGEPCIAASLEKAGLYLAQGVRALQFDLPSRNPYRENPFIRERMARAWARYGGYEPFLQALTQFRKFEQGRITEYGTFREVMQLKRRFFELYHLQAQYYV